MEIKPIPSREAGQFCNNIKLSEFNQIQSYGVLLVLDSDLRVIQHSANLTTLLNTTSSQLLNVFVMDYLKKNRADEDLISWLKQADNKCKCLYWQSEKEEIRIWVWIHQTSEGILLEIEPAAENAEPQEDLLDLAQSLISSMETHNQYRDIHQLVQITCEEIQKITNFDRVIVYKFDKADHSGLVIAEIQKPDMESYLGLRFPANDIPQHVRAMYSDIPLRYIPSIYEKPLKLIPEINSVSKRLLDLSHTNLRMVAPVHIQYLRNMRVSSATSIAILHDKKLWGLIACHHKEPKYLSVNLRLFLILMANALATQVVALECAHDFHQHQKMVAIQSAIIKNITKEASLIAALERYHEPLMNLVSAQGMSIKLQNNLLNFGATPTNDQVYDLASWIQINHPSGTYITHTLPLQYKESMDYKDKACGILAIKMTGLDDHCLIFYRAEFIHHVEWAGNPDAALRSSKVDYSPRDSFERFLQIIHNHSSPWLSHERNAAEFIRSMIVNKQLQDLLQSQTLHDPLTGLLNRLYMAQSLEIEIQRAMREKQTLSVLLADLDFFKKFNDHFGHLAGDLVLKEFSAFLKMHFRGYDHIYRYGGEEFLVILPGISEMDAQEKAEALRQAVKKMVIRFEGKTLPSLTVSMGLSRYPMDGSDGQALIKLADAALYKAKEGGRDRVVVT